MIERLAVDANVVIDWLRKDASAPAQLRKAHAIIVPLPVVGELYAGAFSSARHEENTSAVGRLLAEQVILEPDMDTAILYGRLRSQQRLVNIRQSKMNDFWIAALCIQHDLPLLTNDRGFDTFSALRTIHW